MNLKGCSIKGMTAYVVAVVVFFAVTALYFYPQLEGKVLPAHDVVQYEGMSRDIKDHRIEYGEDPQWNGSMFGGMPAYLITVKYPAMIIKHSVNKVVDFIGQPISFIFLAMLSFWVMLLMTGMNPWIGIVPSLAYGLSTYFFIIIGAGHVTKMWALAYAPMMLGAIFYAYRSNMWLGSALAALFASLEIGTSHFQITYYFLLVIVAFFINEAVSAVKNRTVPHLAKTTALLALAAVLAVGSNFSSLWYTAEHSKDTMRGGSELASAGIESKGLDLDYATGWSYGKTESLNMFIADFMGGSHNGGFSDDGPVAKSLSKYGARQIATQLPSYWGEQPFTAGPTYIGAVTVFLCVLGLFVLQGRRKWWILAVSILALFLAWGRNMMWFTELAFNILPGYNKFRTVSMTLVVLEWSMPFVAAMLLSDLWKGEVDKSKLKKGLLWAGGITGGIALFFALFGGTIFNFSSPADAQLPGDVISAMQTERAAMLRAGSLRSLIFVALSAVSILLFSIGRLKRCVFVAVMAILVCADMLPVNMRYLSGENFVNPAESKIQPTEADKLILADTEPGFRVLNTTVSPFNDATTSYFHRSVGGYHGAKLSRYQDLIDRYLSKMDWEIYDMLNTKYVIAADKEGNLSVQENSDRNGAAWFVDKIYMVDGAQQEITALGDIDTKREAVVDSRFADAVGSIDFEGTDTSASITITDYRPNYQRYVSESQFEEAAVFSEIYYDKGWSAYIDGEPVPYFRADYILRGLVIPAGEHIIEWRFAAPKFKTIESVTLACSIIILLSVAAAVTVTIVRKRKKETK